MMWPLTSPKKNNYGKLRQANNAIHQWATGKQRHQEHTLRNDAPH